MATPARFWKVLLAAKNLCNLKAWLIKDYISIASDNRQLAECKRTSVSGKVRNFHNVNSCFLLIGSNQRRLFGTVSYNLFESTK